MLPPAFRLWSNSSPRVRPALCLFPLRAYNNKKALLLQGFFNNNWRRGRDWLRRHCALCLRQPACFRLPFACGRTLLPEFGQSCVCFHSVLTTTKKPCISKAFLTTIGGEAEIRTLGGLASSTVFKTAALNRSATSPVSALFFRFEPLRGIFKTSKHSVANTREYVPYNS